MALNKVYFLLVVHKQTMQPYLYPVFHQYLVLTLEFLLLFRNNMFKINFYTPYIKAHLSQQFFCYEKCTISAYWNPTLIFVYPLSKLSQITLIPSRSISNHMFLLKLLWFKIKSKLYVILKHHHNKNKFIQYIFLM